MRNCEHRLVNACREIVAPPFESRGAVSSLVFTARSKVGALLFLSSSASTSQSRSMCICRMISWAFGSVSIFQLVSTHFHVSMISGRRPPAPSPTSAKGIPPHGPEPERARGV